MTLKEPRAGKSFAAHVTLVTEAVCQDVHGEGVGAGVGLVTDGAGLGRPLRQFHVKLPVTSQV